MEEIDRLRIENRRLRAALEASRPAVLICLFEYKLPGFTTILPQVDEALAGVEDDNDLDL